MFTLPEHLRYYSPSVCDKLLLKCWHEAAPEWINVLFHVIDSFKTGNFLKENPTKYTVFLLPFLFHSNDEMRKLVLDIDLPVLNAVKRK